MATTLQANCEACGWEDKEFKAALLRQGKMPNYGAVPDVRAPLLCQVCRVAAIELVRAARGIKVLQPGEEVPEGATVIGEGVAPMPAQGSGREN